MAVERLPSMSRVPGDAGHCPRRSGFGRAGGWGWPDPVGPHAPGPGEDYSCTGPKFPQSGNSWGSFCKSWSRKNRKTN